MAFNIYRRFSKMFSQRQNVGGEEYSKLLMWVRLRCWTVKGWECQYFQILGLRPRCSPALSHHHGSGWLPGPRGARREKQILPKHVGSILSSNWVFITFTSLYHAGVFTAVSWGEKGPMKFLTILKNRHSSTSKSMWSFWWLAISSTWATQEKPSTRSLKTKKKWGT